MVMPYGMRDCRPVKVYERWMERIPPVYRKAVLGELDAGLPFGGDEDGNCLARLKH